MVETVWKSSLLGATVVVEEGGGPGTEETKTAAQGEDGTA